MLKKVGNLGLTVVTVALLSAFAYFAYHGHRITEVAGQTTVFPTLGILPYYALRSFLRMLAAYFLSLIFSLAYGYKAATDARAEKILLPVLDVLQSVPILGFFPAAIYFFVNLFRGSILGIELASIFLIFTSQAWNMTFGFYESITTIPDELKEVADAYRVTGWRRFVKLYLPAGIPKLVYNSILSWSGGWYFLIAAEIITIGPVEYSLPGLGSYLIRTAEEGELGLTLAGLATLVAIITVMNTFIWHPLSTWAENFKYEFETGGGRQLPKGWGYRLWYEAPVFRELRKLMISGGSALGRALVSLGSRLPGRSYFPWFGRIISWGFLLLLAYSLLRGLIALVILFLPPWHAEIFTIPQAIFYSFLRLLAAYILSLLWTLPVAIWMGHNEKAYNVLMPVFEVLASVPATALFPILVFLLVGFAGGMELAAVLLVLTGMQWYLLFNIVAGVKSIPKDMKEAAMVFGLKGFKYLRRVVFPALIPSLVTGSITAWGGGWNALIVSEYVVYAGQTYMAFGIGSLLDKAIYTTGNFQVIWSSLMAMVVVIVALNRFFWRKLYEWAAARFSFEAEE